MPLELERHFAETVAARRRELAEAVDLHAAAQARVANLESRLADAQNRQRAITAARLEGESTATEAAEFAALGADIETLQDMVIRARQEAAALDPAAMRDALAHAERELTRHQDQAELNAALNRCREIEALFLRAVAHVHTTAQRGRHVRIGEVWQPSEGLRRLIHYGQAPQGF